MEELIQQWKIDFVRRSPSKITFLLYVHLFYAEENCSFNGEENEELSLVRFFRGKA